MKNCTYTIKDMGERVLVHATSIPLDDFVQFGKKWAKRDLEVMLPGIARALGAMFAVATKEQAPIWEQEVREEAKARANGDVELAWFYGPDAGISSLTIFKVLSQHGNLLPPDFRPDVPHDPADFERCHNLLQILPAWRERLVEVAQQYPGWTKLVDAWDELTALWLTEAPSGNCTKLYQRMQKLGG